LKTNEPVPKLIYYALPRTVLGQTFAGFQPYKTAKFKVASPKTEVLEKPQMKVNYNTSSLSAQSLIAAFQQFYF
jgi:hypothetical protein